MPTTLTSRALIWAALLAVLLPYCLAFQYSKSEDGAVEVSKTQDIFSAEADAMLDDDDDEEGEVGYSTSFTTPFYIDVS